MKKLLCRLFGHKWGRDTPTSAHYCHRCLTCSCRDHGCIDCHRGLFDRPWCVRNGGDGKRR
jgi:hypothetical protein